MTFPEDRNAPDPMIPPTLPHITSSNWRQLHDQGWRYYAKLPRRIGKREDAIKELQTAYGTARVTVGEPWDSEKHGPVASELDVAVYVKDVPDLVEELHEDLQKFEKTGKLK